MDQRVNKTPQRKLDSIARSRAKRNEDPERLEKHRQYMRDYKEKNKDKLNAQSSERYHANPEKRFKYRLRRIGVEATPVLLKHLLQHPGTCDLCGGQPDGRWKELAIDHCHVTHTFRGMLCGKCNKGIGLFRDDTTLLDKAVEYLMQHRKLLPNEYIG